MHIFSRAVIAAAVVSTSAACSSPTDNVPVIAFWMARTPNTDTAGRLGFHFAVTNPSADAVFFSTCNGRIRPDITVAASGQAPYVVNEAYCVGGLVSLNPLDAGATVSGEGSIARVAGARYTPSIAYLIAQRFDAPGRRVTSADFRAP